MPQALESKLNFRFVDELETASSLARCLIHHESFLQAHTHPVQQSDDSHVWAVLSDR